MLAHNPNVKKLAQTNIPYQEDQMSKGLAQIMKQAQMMQQKMARLQEEAAQQTAEATAGGGAVTALVSGKNQILSLAIKKEAVDPEDVEMLQDLIMAAVNEALAKVHAEMADQMGKITGGLNIPGLF
jgi:nucleoid-associated protein EbfC